MVLIIKAVEGSLLGISLVPFKAKSWVIIEVERASTSSNLSLGVRRFYV
jgi:hypothetical protein